MDTVRHKCVYRGCGNDDRLKRNISYFKFPVSNEHRTELWKKNCGNANIAAMCDRNELKRKVICELHFSSRDIRKNSKRKLLTNTAIPIRYSGKDKHVPTFSESTTSSCVELVGEHFRTYSRKRSNLDADKLSIKPSHNSPSSHDSRCNMSSGIVQYVVVRGDLLKELKWPVGAIVAQACHAVTAATHLFYEDEVTQQYLKDLDNMHKVVLEAIDEQSLVDLKDKLTENDIKHKLWIEQPENIPTCLVAKPYPKEEVQRYFKKFKLFKT